MLWGCFAASGTGGIECIKGMMKSEDRQGILEWNVLHIVRKLGLRQRFWGFQQDNDQKDTSSSTKEWLKRKRWTVLKWPTMNSEIPLKTFGESWNLPLQKELECIEEWQKLPADGCKKLLDGYKRCLEAVSIAKGSATKYCSTVPISVSGVHFVFVLFH